MSVPVWISAIKLLREAKGLTQGELAQKAGITANTLSAALNEQTSPQLRTIEAVCTVLEVPMWRLFVDDRQARLLTQQEAADQTTAKQADIAARVERRVLSRLADIVAEATADEMGHPPPQAPQPRPVQVEKKAAGGRRRR